MFSPSTSVDLIPGSLTRAGMLYEGNWNDWANRMEDMLEIHQVKPFVPIYDHPLNGPIPDGHAEEKAKAVALISINVSPILLSRLSKDDRKDAVRLWSVLKTLAQPFRLLKLPVAVRKLVYDYIWPVEGQEFELDMLYATWSDNVEPLLGVCRTVREETMPVFMSRARFNFGSMILNDINNTDGEYVADFARDWAKNVGPADIKNLRCLTSVLHKDDVWWKPPHLVEVRFTFSPDDGLAGTVLKRTRVSEVSIQKRRESDALLEKHINTVKTNSAALGLQGESIILTLISKPELWVNSIWF